MKLGDYEDSLACELAFWYLGLINPDYPIRELGKLSLDVSTKFRSLAVIRLLAHGASDGYFHNLIRSGRARLTYLQKLRQQGIQDDHHQCSGRYEPLTDAIAAGELDLARQIVAFSPLAFRAGHEYEDDYVYAQILHRLIQDPCPEADIAPLLAQFEAYLAGEASARFDVVKALAEKSQDDFDASFAALLDEREAQIDADKKRGQLADRDVLAQRQIFVEGLALLRLAERRGLATEPEYQFCPSLARIPMVTPFPGE